MWPILLFSALMGGMQAYQSSRANAAAGEARKHMKIQQDKALDLQKEQLILTARAQAEANKLYTDQQGQLRDQRQYDTSVEAEAARAKMRSRSSRNTLTMKYTGMNADDLLGIRIPQ